MSRRTKLPRMSGKSKKRTYKDDQPSETHWLYKLFHKSRTPRNPNSRKNRNNEVLGQVPGQFPNEKVVERKLCAERLYRSLGSYQKCQGSQTHYEHYVHYDDTTGNPASCWKCIATTQRKKPIPKEQGEFKKNPEKILRKLSFACLPAKIEPRDFAKFDTSPVLKRGRILLVKRYNNARKLCPAVEEYAEIPITESGSVREIVISVVQYYHLHFKCLPPNSGFGHLMVCGIEKIDETYYQCNLNM